MKELRGAAGTTVSATPAECMALLSALDRYPSWYPEVVRRVAVLESSDDGLPTRAETRLQVSHGPLVKEFNLIFAVRIEPPGIVELVRVPRGPQDREEFVVTWRLEDRGETGLRVELRANLSAPRLLPLGGVGDAIAEGFLRAAVAALAPAP